MKKAVIAVALLLSVAMFSQTNDSQEILRKIDRYRIPYKKFLIRTKITSYNGNKVKETAVFDTYIDGEDKSLVIAKEYKNKGMKILYVDEKMWVHLANSSRPIRITPIQRLMGQASNGDVARVSYVAEYIVKAVNGVRLGEHTCYRLFLKAKSPSSTYHKIILYVRKKDYRPLKAEFYLLSGKHFKTAVFTAFEPFHGKVLLKKMTIYDELRTDMKTIFEYTLIEEKELPARYYNKNYLIHVQGL